MLACPTTVAECDARLVPSRLTPHDVRPAPNAIDGSSTVPHGYTDLRPAARHEHGINDQALPSSGSCSSPRRRMCRSAVQTPEEDRCRQHCGHVFAAMKVIVSPR